ncbi:D-lactate dehydrogenase [Stipitochalara longipes BDJ]|nr:D-lactate dehydrogenase [Stipitochalara longipes BDJ]
MDNSQDSKVAALESFLKDYPHITLITSSSPKYASVRAVFSLDSTATPLAIVRPQSASDVALLIKYVKSSGIKFVIRTGGHSIFGLSIVEGALTIDMREINYVNIDKQSSTARIGGGILEGELAGQLEKEGLATPTGNVGSIGHVGWATYGGYGLFRGNFGLGVDQIVAAKVVDAKGELGDADERLLKGIRGAGGIFGVIVELTIKVYPLKTILAGSLFYASRDLIATFKTFNLGYQELSAEGLPPQLTLNQTVVNTPQGRAFGVHFAWSSEDETTGRHWLQKIEELGHVVKNMISVTTIPAWIQETARFTPTGFYGEARTHNIRQLTDQAMEIIGRSLEKMPADPGCMFAIHDMRGGALKSGSASVFGTRDPHFLLEILGGAVMEQNREQAIDWSTSLWQDLQHIDPGYLLPSTYISLDRPSETPGQASLSKIFGSNDQEVLTLKEVYDPDDVFDLALPKLKNYL